MRKDLGLFRAATWAQDGLPFVCITVTHTGGSTPRLKGAQMWVNMTDQIGTVGGGAFEHHVISQARALLTAPYDHVIEEVSIHLTHELGMCCGGKMTALLRRYHAPKPIYLFGAGHVASALATHLSFLEAYQVIVIDERVEWITQERFPQGIELCCEEPEGWLRQSPLPHGAIALIMTHDHQLDEQILSLLIPQIERNELHFVGMIGSAGKWGRFMKRFKERGTSQDVLDRIQCPVGHPIHAQEPHEIAISICAELILRQQQRTLSL